MQKQENCFRNNSLAEVFHKFTLLKTRVLIRRLRNSECGSIWILIKNMEENHISRVSIIR